MKLISVNTGRPRDVVANGRVVRTSIWKNPRRGPVHVATLNIDGDEQSDLAVHGGTYKAVYCYPSEHYEYWRRELPDVELPWGAFGENLTTEGLLETDVRIGDQLEIGSAAFLVTQPRQPCFKLGIRMGRADMVKRFVVSGRSGFYVRVVREGDIVSGDIIRLAKRATGSITVSEIFALEFDEDATDHALTRAAAAPGLSPSWRDHFLKRLDALRS
jgi:MOSC domain-containing protein YiiM